MEKPRGFKMVIGSKSFTLIGLLIIIIAVFTLVTGGNYLKLRNISSILNAMVVTSFLTIGVGYLIIFGEIDLSTGAVGTMCAILLGVFSSKWGLPWYISLIAALAVGAFAGFINAILVNVLNFQAFIATLATMSVTQGLGYVFCQAIAIDVNHPVFKTLGTTKLFSGVMPISVILMLLLLLIYGLILSKTKYGRAVYLCGSNKKAALLAGLNPKKTSYILFINSGALAALSGCILSMRLGSATAQGITTSSFTGITAAILGGISFGGGTGGMFGCFIGLLILSFFNNGLTVLGLGYGMQTIASGALLLIALILDFLNTRRMTMKQK